MTAPASAAAPAVHRGRSAPARAPVAPRRPRRVSGPARSPALPVRHPDGAERGLALGLLGILESLSRHEGLDRLIRGRTWIALIAFALIGIVTLQLLELTLNANIGRALVRTANLQRENTALSIESSELAAGERIEARAARLEMQLVPEGALRFLAADPRVDIARAAAALSRPARTASTASPEEAGSGSSAPASTGEPAPAAPATAVASSGEQVAAAAAPASGEASASPSGEAGATPGGEATATAGAEPAASAGAAPATEGAAEAAPAGAETGSQPVGGAGGTQSEGAG